MASPEWICNCVKYCGGAQRAVSRSTFYNHAPFRHQLAPISASLLAAHAASLSTSEFGQSTVSHSSQSVYKRSRLNLEERAGADLELESMDDGRNTPVVTGPGCAPSHSVAGHGSAQVDDHNGYDLGSPDPGCVTDDDEIGRGTLPREPELPSSDINGDWEDPPAEPIPPDHGHSQTYVGSDFVPHIQEMKVSLEFKKALEGASLENGDLSPEDLARLRNPPTSALTIEDNNVLLSLKVFMSTTTASERVYTNVCADIMDVHPEDTLLSHAAIKKKVAALSGVVPIVHDMCPNSCMAYTGPFAKLDICPFCETSRYVPHQLETSTNRTKTRVPCQHFYTIPLGPQLQALWRAPQSAENMQHRVRRTREIFEELDDTDGIIETFNDVYHGREYLEAVSRGDIATNDMVLMFSIDGAQLYQDKTSDCWIYIWVILDLPPDLCYKKKHVLPGGFIPGPNNPKHTDSFLFPGFHHIAALQKEGLQIWNALENRLFVSFLYLYLGCADGPGSVHFTNLVGHHGAYPCRLYCDLKGRHKPGGSHYYPALLKPTNYSVDGCDHEDVDVRNIHNGSPKEYQESLNYLLNSRNPTDYKLRRKDTGISNISIFSGLPSHRRLPIPSGFPGDLMHVPNINLGELLPPLWRGSFQCADTDNVTTWDWAVLVGDTWKEHGAAVGAARQYIPGSFDQPPRNIAEKINSRYKAKEWQGYFYGLAPGLLCTVLPRIYWRHFCKLVHAIRILHQRSISRKDLEDAQRYMQEFAVEFELLYVQQRTDRLHFVRPCIHALLHVALETARLGPAPLYSAWTMERVVGDLGGEIGQPSNPYQNLSERGLRRCQTNAMKAAFPILNRDQPKDPRGSLELGDRYLLLRAKEEYASYIAGDEGRTIKEYLVEKESQLRNMIPSNWQGPKVVRWARLRLPNEQIARSMWKERLKAPDKLRRASCVKLFMNGQLEFADVEFYFNAEIGGERHTLALISLYSRPDETLFEESCWTVWSITKLGATGLRVVEAKSIISVVSIQPHDHHVEANDVRFFIWEQIGLDMALLSGTLGMNLEDV